MRVLLTGATGLIGSHLMPLLLSRGHKVTAISRHAPCAPGLEDGGLRWVEGNVLQEPLLIAETGAEALIHLAWETTPGQYWTSAANQQWAGASLRLIRRFIADGGKRVVVAGTCAEYRWDNSLCDEKLTPLESNSAYAAGKTRLRELLRQEADASVVNWARIFFPYGPGESGQRLLPQIIRPMLRGETVRCSHGRQRRDYIHAQDVAQALLVLCESSAPGDDFNVCSGAAVSVRQIVEECLKVTDSDSPVMFDAVPTRGGEPDIIAGNNCRLRDLGWEPKISLREGITRYCEWAAKDRPGD